MGKNFLTRVSFRKVPVSFVRDYTCGLEKSLPHGYELEIYIIAVFFFFLISYFLSQVLSSYERKNKTFKWRYGFSS